MKSRYCGTARHDVCRWSTCACECHESGDRALAFAGPQPPVLHAEAPLPTTTGGAA